MWVHSLLYLPASQAVFPGVEPMEWGWRWGKDEAVLLGNGGECSTACTEAAGREWELEGQPLVQSEGLDVWSRTKGQTATKPLTCVAPSFCDW